MAPSEARKRLQPSGQPLTKALRRALVLDRLARDGLASRPAPAGFVGPARAIHRGGDGSDEAGLRRDRQFVR